MVPEEQPDPGPKAPPQQLVLWGTGRLPLRDVMLSETLACSERLVIQSPPGASRRPFGPEIGILDLSVTFMEKERPCGDAARDYAALGPRVTEYDLKAAARKKMFEKMREAESSVIASRVGIAKRPEEDKPVENPKEHVMIVPRKQKVRGIPAEWLLRVDSVTGVEATDPTLPKGLAESKQRLLRLIMLPDGGADSVESTHRRLLPPLRCTAPLFPMALPNLMILHHLAQQ